MNEKLIKVLETTKIPVYPSVRMSKEKVYFVFNYWTQGENFGDNKPLNEHYYLQLHLYCPDDFNSVKLRQDTKKLLSESFSYPTVISASDEEGQHWVFEFEDATGVE